MSLPKEFNAHQGRYYYDSPQKILKESDYTLVDLYHRDGTTSCKHLFEISWKCVGDGKDIIGWRILNEN